MKAVLVTGGHGFLGSRVVAFLNDSGLDVFAPKRSELQLKDPEAVQQYLVANKIEVIVHLAACLDRNDDDGQWQDTFLAGRCVVEAAANVGNILFIGAGSMDELGPVDGEVQISAPVQPLSRYGLAKSLLFDIAAFNARIGALQVEWVRPTGIYGPGQQGAMLIPSAFAAAIKDEPSQFSDGEQSRDFVFVDDVARWFASAAQLDGYTPGLRVHHIGSGRSRPVKDVLVQIAKLSGAEFRLGAIPRRAGESNFIGLPPYKDDRVPLNSWKPEVTLEAGLQATWQEWEKN